MMEYVINLLEKDKAILEKCLTEWESEEYPIAKKEREDKLTEINKAINILTNIIKKNYKETYFVGNYCDSVKTHFKNFKIDYHKCVDPRNYIKNSETKLFKCTIRPYGKWYEYFFNDTPASWYTFSGVFSIDKRDIIQHSIERYMLLKNIVGVHSNPEAGHYIERSWGAIFYPLIHTIKIQE